MVGSPSRKTLQEPGFIDEVQQKALRLKQALAAVHDRHPDLVEEVRGRGLLTGLKLKVPPPDVMKSAATEKLLIAGAADNVVRLLPPLNITDTEIEDAVNRLEKAATKVALNV